MRHPEGAVILHGHQVVGGAPVAQTADIDGGLGILGDIRCAAAQLRCLGFHEGQQLRRPRLLAEYLAQQGDGAAEVVAEHTVHAGAQSDHRHAGLLLQGVRLVRVLVLGDDDIRRAGEDLLRLRRLCVGAAHTAGGQRGEGVAVDHHIGACHAVEHLGTLAERGVVDVLHAAQQAHVAHIAVQPQSARADAHHPLIAAGRQLQLTADHVGDCHRLRCVAGVVRRGLLAAAEQGQRHHQRQHKGKKSILHRRPLLSDIFFRLSSPRVPARRISPVPSPV